MEFNLSDDEKKRITEHALNVVESEIYRELLAVGFIPEDFVDIASIDTNIYPDIVIHGPRISSLIARKQQLQEKLDNLT